MEYRYTAIVLKKREVGETDRIYTFYTREGGKVASIAKGVRKSEAKLASSLETGSKVEVMIVRTRGMGKIAGAVLEESYPAVRQSFDALRLSLEALQTVDRLVEPEEKDETLSVLLEQYLALLERLVIDHQESKLACITEAFFFKLFYCLGYTLQLNVCSVSGEKLVKGERLLLSLNAGGVVLSRYATQIVDGVAVSEAAVKLLRLFAQATLEQLSRVIVDPATVAELTRFRKLFLLWIRR